MRNQLADLESCSSLLRSTTTKNFKAVVPEAVNVSQLCFHLLLLTFLPHLLLACIHSAIHHRKVIRHCFVFAVLPHHSLPPQLCFLYPPHQHLHGISVLKKHELRPSHLPVTF
jgi:hypothetical protein